MRYQNRYPKTASRTELRILAQWENPNTGLGVNGGRGKPALADGQVKRAVNSVRIAIKNGGRSASRLERPDGYLGRNKS